MESDGNTHMFFVDGGNNRVGIGEDQTLDALLVIKGDWTMQQSLTPESGQIPVKHGFQTHLAI